MPRENNFLLGNGERLAYIETPVTVGGKKTPLMIFKLLKIKFTNGCKIQRIVLINYLRMLVLVMKWSRLSQCIRDIFLSLIFQSNS